MRFLGAAFALLLGCLAAHAQYVRPVPGHNTSPYTITDQTQDFSAGYQNTAGKVSVSTALTPGEKTAIVLLPGQSNSTNITPSTYTPVNAAACQQLNVYSGSSPALYRAVDPLLGPTGAGGTWAARWCDKTVTAGTFQRVIMVPIAISGTSSQHWKTEMFWRLYVAILQLRVLGYLDTTNADLRWFVLVQQGETDAQNGVAAATYAANWITVTDAVAAMGWPGKWWFARQTWNAGVANATIQGAQTSAPLIDGVTRMAGVNSDARTVGFRQGDNTHWNDAGGDQIATDTQVIIAANY